jgi:hypothetical protein
MMPTHLWTILCEKAPVNRDTGNVSLIEVVEDVVVEVDKAQDLTAPLASPILLPVSWALVSTFERVNWAQAEKTGAKFLIITPSGNKIGEGSIEIDLSQHIRVHHIVSFNGFLIVEPGANYFQIEVENSAGTFVDVGRLPLNVVFKK